MHEYIFRTAIRRDEAETFVLIEEFDGACHLAMWEVLVTLLSRFTNHFRNGVALEFVTRFSRLGKWRAAGVSVASIRAFASAFNASNPAATINAEPITVEALGTSPKKTKAKSAIQTRPVYSNAAAVFAGASDSH